MHCNGSDWGYTLNVTLLNLKVQQELRGTDDVWMYIGTFVNDFEFPLTLASDMLHIVVSLLHIGDWTHLIHS